MPFPHRVVTKREDIGEVFNGSTENVLQKSNVSNLIGLLNQLNKISLYAHEIFTDVLQTTTNTSKRIKSAKQRVNNLQSSLPKIEGMLITNAPNMFYDNPYAGKEYLRNDPMNGLLFSREDATMVVNRRREQGNGPTDMSQMDRVIPERGPCIKQFSDADFFINEWLANEKIKREEERQRRKAMKANRKKERHKRTKPKTIQKLKRKRYDAQGNELKEDEPDTIAVIQYELTDDTNRDFDALLKSNKKAAKAKKQAQKEEARQRAQQQAQVQSQQQPPQASQNGLKASRPQHNAHMVSYGVPDKAVKHVSVLSNGGPPPNPMQLHQSESDSPPPSSNAAVVPPPNPVQMNGGPPPNPLQLKPTLSQTQKTQNKLRGLSQEIPRDNSLLESANLIDDQTYSPPELYATKYQKRDLDKEAINKMDLSDASQIIATSPKQVAPVGPKLGFLGDINSFKAGSLKRTEVNVNRHKPKDKRTNLLDALRGGGAKNQLSSVNLRKIAPKKEEKKNLIFQAMADRRRHMEDSSDESDSDWGSESD
mmetsp:Transcript_55880/g.50279  ORF Transcript_55880/g.50279 Transcript_55880/m.50279 type:complete len:537 (-) Transcript_55880:181-1791(-)